MFWKTLDPVDLEAGLVQRFDDQTMAIVGYEANVVNMNIRGGFSHHETRQQLLKENPSLIQVFKNDSGDIPVPITWVYNHHYKGFLVSKYSPSNVTDPRPQSKIPLEIFFGEGNGGEFR